MSLPLFRRGVVAAAAGFALVAGAAVTASALTQPAESTSRDIALGDCPAQMPPLSTENPLYVDSSVAVYAGGTYLAAGAAAETEGLLVVRGDAVFDKEWGGVYNVGTVGVGSQITPEGGTTMLAVGGDLHVGSETRVEVGARIPGGGGVLVGGTVDGEVVTFGAPLESQLGPYAALAQWGDFQGVVTETSAGLAAMTANGTVTRGTGMVFTGTGDPELQVFTVDAVDLDGVSEFRFENVTADMPILVNVTGGPLVDLQSNFVSLDGDRVDTTTSPDFGTAASRILWNFADTPLVNIGGGGQWMGSILVPVGDINLDVSTNGRLYVGGDIYTHGTGSEHHNYPWIGLHCSPLEVAPAEGGFAVKKTLAGDGEGLVPADTEFTVEYAYDLAGTPTTGHLTVTADGTFVSGPQNLPVGTEVTFTEVDLPSVEGVVWGAPVFSPATVTVGAGEVTEVLLTNTADIAPVPVGGFSIAKALTGDAADAVPADTPFTVEYAYELEGVPTTGTLTVLADGAAVDGPQNLAAGTVVSFTELDLPALDGVVWGAPAFSPATITVGDGTNAAVTLTNTADAVEAPVGGFSLAKAVTGPAAGLVPADTAFVVEYAYELDGVATTGTLTVLADGTVVSGPQTLPAGTVVAFTEIDLPEVPGVVWGTPSFSAESITIGDGEDTAVTLTNTAEAVEAPVGGFSLAKAVEGAAAGLVPAGTEFTVDYAYTLDGVVVSGTLILPADGTVVDGPQNLPVGTEVGFTEVQLPDVSGVVWGAPAFSDDTVTVGAGGNALVTLTNTAGAAPAPVGGFSVAKALAGTAAAAVPADTAFTVEYAYDLDGAPTTGRLSVLADGTVAAGPQTLPVGTVVTFTEIDLPALDGVVWGAPAFSPASVTVGDGADTLVTLTNTADEVVVPVGGFHLAKTVTGDATALVPAETVFTVQYAYELDGAPLTGTLTLPADGTAVAGPQTLPAGTVVTFSEVDLPALDGVVWGEPAFSADTITVGDGTDPLIRLTNTAEQVEEPVGGFSVAKALVGDAAADVPADTAFTVEYAYANGDQDVSGRLVVRADGTPVEGPQTLPVGTVVRFTEIDLPEIDGVMWEAPAFTVDTVTIGAGENPLVVVTNTATAPEVPGVPAEPDEPTQPGEPTAPGAPTEPEGVLAFTGAASVTGIVLGALTLLAAGFAALALRRRGPGRRRA